jgi:hypothetical protein
VLGFTQKQFTFNTFGAPAFNIGGGLYTMMYEEYENSDGSYVTVQLTNFTAGEVRLTYTDPNGVSTVFGEEYPISSTYLTGWNLENEFYGSMNAAGYSTIESFELTSPDKQGIILEKSPDKVASVDATELVVPPIVTRTTPRGNVVDYPTHYLKEFMPPTSTGTGSEMHNMNFRWNGVDLQNGYPVYYTEEQFSTSASEKRAKLYAVWYNSHGFFQWQITFPYKTPNAIGWDGWTTSGAYGDYSYATGGIGDAALPDYSYYSYSGGGDQSRFIAGFVPDQVATVNTGLLANVVASVEVDRIPVSPDWVEGYNTAFPPPIPISSIEVVSEGFIGSFSPDSGAGVYGVALFNSDIHYPNTLGIDSNTEVYKYYSSYKSAHDPNLRISKQTFQQNSWVDHLQLLDYNTYPTLYNQIGYGLQHPTNGYLFKNVVYNSTDPKILESFDLYRHSTGDTTYQGLHSYGNTYFGGTNLGPPNYRMNSNDPKWSLQRNASGPIWPDIKIDAPKVNQEIGSDYQLPAQYAHVYFQSGTGSEYAYDLQVDGNNQISITPPASWNAYVGLAVMTVYWKNADDLNVIIRDWDDPDSFYADTHDDSTYQQLRLDVSGPLAPTLPDDVASVSAAAYTAGSFLITYSPFGMAGMIFEPTGGSGGLTSYSSTDNGTHVKAVQIRGWDQSPNTNSAVLPAQTHYLWVYTSNIATDFVDLKYATTSNEMQQILSSAGIIGSNQLMYYISRTYPVIQNTHSSLVFINHNYYQQSTEF